LPIWADRHSDKVFVNWILAIPEGARVLEVGSGRYPKTEEISSQKARHICADFHTEKREESSSVRADCVYLPFREQSFDRVLALALLEHVYAPWQALQEFARVLRPQGQLLWHAAFCQPVHRDPEDYFRFTDAGARVMTEQAGLTVIQITPMEGWGAPAGDPTRPSYYAVEAVKQATKAKATRGARV